jgi:hypothetical protein
MFTLLPVLTGHGREHHGEILREAAALADAGLLKPLPDPPPLHPGHGRPAPARHAPRGSSGCDALAPPPKVGSKAWSEAVHG